MDQFIFAAEVVLNGLMTGVMYALVALGFVLIFKRRASSTMPKGFWRCSRR